MKIRVLILLLLASSIVMAQKIKEKDDVFYVENKPFLKKGCKVISVGPCVLHTPDGATRVVSIITYQYKDKRKVYEDQRWQMKEVDAYYYELRFLTAEGEMHTTQHPRSIIKELYNFGLIADDGSIDQKMLDEFVKIYHEEPPVRVTDY